MTNIPGLTQPVVGCRYESTRRKGQKVQVEAVQGKSDNALVSLLFLRSQERWKTPLWLFRQTFKRDTTGALEPEAVLR